MISNRIFYLITLFAVWVLASFQQNLVTSIMVYAVLLLPVISFLLMLFAYLSLDAKQSSNRQTLYKGDTVRISFSARCRFAISFAYLDLRINRAYKSKFRIRRADSILCSCFGQPVNVKFDVDCPYRGIYHVGAKKVRVVDMLGLFALHKKMDLCRVTVYPRVSALVGLEIDHRLVGQESVTKNALKKDDILISHVRPYTPTDRLKTIHWKLSSKLNQYMVKTYEPLKEVGVVVLLDFQSKTNLKQSVRINNEDKIIECGLSVVANCIADMLTARVVYMPASKILEKHNVDDMQNYPTLYNLLACVEVDGETGIAEALRAFMDETTCGSNIVVVTDRADDKLRTTFREGVNAGNKMTLMRVIGENEKEDSWQGEVKKFMADGFKTVAVPSSHRGPIIF
ncbi:MAG: DUF58 domain-containing protein [Clostridia bacterium]|nr:DUF58 domain-containing protein [Clostridia bacterium]